MTKSRGGETHFTELLASKELNRRIIEAIPGGIVHVTMDGSIQTANAEALRILGLSYDELTDRYTQDFAPETIWENGEACPLEDYPVTRALMTGEAQAPATIGVRHKDGEVSWAIFTAVPVKSAESDETTGAVVSFLDVSESKRNLIALRESEARLRSVVDSTPSVILTTTPDGIVLFLNRSPEPELPKEAIIGSSIFDFIEAEQEETVRACLERVAASREVDGFEVSRQSNVGQTDYSVRVGPIIDRDQVIALSLVATDITMIRQLQNRIAISDRLASIGTLAAGVAHEINNPLTYLLLSLNQAESLVGSERDDEVLLDCLSTSTDAATRIQKIVGDLAAFSRSGSDELEAVNLEHAMESALEMAGNQTRYRARLVRDYSPTLPVMANSVRLTQVFLNLVVNAAQSIDAGDVANNSITVAIRPQGTDVVVVEIADTGCGMPPELVPRIFEPFVTTKEVGEGTGLGLHICHNIVDSFDGSIDVHTVEGKGTTFSLSFPIARGVVPNLASPSQVKEECRKRLRILVVDDEPAICKSLALLLDHHEVTLATSGLDALNVLANDSFDIIFCDLIMPNLTGMDVNEFVTKARPDLAPALIFMTGGAFTERASAFLAECQQPVLAKPFTLEQVEHLVAARSGEIQTAAQ